MADNTPARTRQSFSNPQARVSSIGLHPTDYPRLNRLILRLVSKLLTWLGPSHRWLCSQHDIRAFVPLLLGCFIALAALAASNNLLWTPVVLAVMAILFGFISVWSLTYWCLPLGFATYLSVFGVLTAAVLVPTSGGRFGGGMRVHLYWILCSIWMAFLPLVVTISIFMFLCGRMLVERNISERVWPQQLGTFEFELGMIPPPDSDIEHRRWTLSETYASPINNRDRSTHAPYPIGREELAIVHSSL